MKDQIRWPEGRGVNESQLKFLEGTWPMFQIWPNTPLFQLDQDHIAIVYLLALETELSTWNLSRSIKQFKQIHDQWIHQQVTRKDLQRPWLRIKAQLHTRTLAPSQTFYRTSSVRDQESTTEARWETMKTRALDPVAQEQDRLPPASTQAAISWTEAKNKKWAARTHGRALRNLRLTRACTNEREVDS
jgi:hypothetical protein